MRKKILSLCLSTLVFLSAAIPQNTKAEEPTINVTQEQQIELTASPTLIPTKEQTVSENSQITPQIAQIQYSYINSLIAVLSIESDSTVYANAYIAGYPSSVTSITGYLYLDRKVGSIWVNEWSWVASTPSAFLFMNETWNVTTHATYRLRLRACVYSGSSSELITYYSSECTY